MEMVLDHYSVKLRRVNQLALRGKCPLPTHTSETSEKSFSVQTQKNIWRASQLHVPPLDRGRRAATCSTSWPSWRAVRSARRPSKSAAGLFPHRRRRRNHARLKRIGEKPSGKLVAGKKEGSDRTNKTSVVQAQKYRLFSSVLETPGDHGKRRLESLVLGSFPVGDR